MDDQEIAIFRKLNDYFKTGDGITKIPTSELKFALRRMQEARETLAVFHDYGSTARQLSQDVERISSVLHARRNPL